MWSCKTCCPTNVASVAKGAAIRLAPAGDALGIAEGIETALSASALFGVPCWAAVNAGMLALWRPPHEGRGDGIFGGNEPRYPRPARAPPGGRRARGGG